METATVESIAREFGLDLEVSGDELRCLCPNHDDHAPSLYINSEKQQWICFGCGRGGGVVALYAFLYKCSITEAINAIGVGPVLASYIQRLALEGTDSEEDAAPFLLRDLLVDGEDNKEVTSQIIMSLIDGELEMVGEDGKF